MAVYYSVTMKMPVGQLLVVLWCLLRGVVGTLGAISLVKYASRPGFDWSLVAYIFAVDGAVWLVLAFAVLSRWKVGRWLMILWCGFDVARSSYDFVSVSRASWMQLLEGCVYVVVFAVQTTIVVYLLRPAGAKYFNPKKQSAT
jgi:hypothetical protein